MINCATRYLCLLALTGLLACAGTTGQTTSDVPMLPQPAGQTFVYVCGDSSMSPTTLASIPLDTAEEGLRFNVTMRTGPGEAAVWLPLRFHKGYLVLGQTRAASGARYAGDGVVLWTKGSAALLEVDGETWRNCQLDRRRSIWEHAKLSGVDFRAVGNEPGWHLEIRNARSMTFVYDYGERTVVTDCPDPVTDPTLRTTTYQSATATHELSVTLSGRSCRDSMSGETFETTVEVRLDDRLFLGCGQALH